MGKLLLSTKVLGLAFSKLAFTGLLTLPLVFLFSYIGNTLNKLKLLVEGKLGLVPTDRVENHTAATIKNLIDKVETLETEVAALKSN